MKTAVKTPLKYVGSKAKLAPTIIGLMPPHKTYCEVFGGSGAVLFAKQSNHQGCRKEIYNDRWGDIPSFYRVLRDKPSDLQAALRLTPYSRQEYFAAFGPRDGIPDIEQARRFYVRSRQSFAGKFGSTYRSGWGFGRKSSQARTWVNAIETLPTFAERLRTVDIESNDFGDILDKYDDPDTLFYLDPPYRGGTRYTEKDGPCRSCTVDTLCARCRLYYCDMADADQMRLLDRVLNLKGKVIISGYDDTHCGSMYMDRLRGWTLHRYSQVVACSTPNDNGTRRRMDELLWLSPNCTKEIDMIAPNKLIEARAELVAEQTRIASALTNLDKAIASLSGTVKTPIVIETPKVSQPNAGLEFDEALKGRAIAALTAEPQDYVVLAAKVGIKPNEARLLYKQMAKMGLCVNHKAIKRPLTRYSLP